MANLQPNEIVVAINNEAASAALHNLLMSLSGGPNQLVRRGSDIANFEVDVSWDVYNADVHLVPATAQDVEGFIVFDSLGVEITFPFKVNLDFNALWDHFSPPLPSRCYSACIPFTDICATVCLDIGSLDLSDSIFFPFNLAGVYRPHTEETDTDIIVYPELDYIDRPGLDVNRILYKICEDIAASLPWPLSMIADDFCSLFSEVFGFFEDALDTAINDLVVAFLRETDWMGLQIKSLHLYKLPRDHFPGTGVNGKPAIPVNLSNPDLFVNSSAELQLSLTVTAA